MPPPATPPPRRFLSSSRQISTTEQPPSSSLRYHNANATVASQQFAPAPRFATSSTSKRTNEEQILSSPPLVSPLVARTRRPTTVKQPRDDIEDELELDPEPQTEPLPDNADEEMLLDTIEFDLPPPKRRRMTPPPTFPATTARKAPHQTPRRQDPIVVSSSPHADYRSSASVSPVPAPPEVPRTPSRAHSRHGLNYTTPAATVSSASTTSKPRFIVPNPTDEDNAEETLPPIFSPHRRGQRFIPGGLASTVRDWVLELTSGGGPAQTFAQRLGLRRKGDEVRIRVKELVEGTEGRHFAVESTVGQRWLLIWVEGGGVGLRRVVRVGDAMALRMPLWEVQLEEVVYGVAVNWSVVDPG
ncbi:MAG: hypothetical protein MMC23_009796 [Stictis urceolatum]|nr:hypothetical protein [Stictis urceolata]